MIQIDIDTQDTFIEAPGLTVLDSMDRFVRVIDAQGGLSPYFIPPSQNALMLRPQQLFGGWPSAVKFRAGDYGMPTGWEEQEVRAPSDWFMHSTGAVSPLSLIYDFPANTGWFIEFRAYAQPKAMPGPIFDFAFGEWFQIVIDNTGHMALFDCRHSISEPVGEGNIANFNSFVNLDVQLMVLPFRQRQILVWSPNRGGYIDAPVRVGVDGTITEHGAATVYRSVTPPAALVAITPLLYPADGVPPCYAPSKAPATPLTQVPSFTGSQFDQPGSSLCTLAAVTQIVTSPPVKEFVYSVTMQGNTGHQTAAQQGIVGIGPSTALSSGASVLSGSSYPYSLLTPFLYLVAYGYPRKLGPRTYSTTTLTGILSAKLTMSKDRAAKSFTFTVDNPANITGIGANYSGLKNLQNRRCRVYLTNSTFETGGADIAADLDPDTSLIVANGNKRVYLFDGFTDQPEFVDGVDSKLIVRCQGLRKRLRSYIFPDRPCYDGMLVTSVITDILTRAGFVGPADISSQTAGVEIVCEPSTSTLPSAVPGDEPLFAPAIGTSAEEFLDVLIRYTGWMLDDLIAVGAANSAWYWTSSDYYASSVYAAQGSPTVSLVSAYNSSIPGGLQQMPDAVLPNQGLGSLVMLDNPPPKQSLEELIANEIFVIGVDDRGQTLIAHARDEDSISTSSANNYVGEVRTFILICQWINEQPIANTVCAALYAGLTQARTHLTFTLPDFYPQLGISAPLTLSGYWNGQIDEISADLGNPRCRKTSISVLKSM
jgi:hypothetical protein